MALLPTADPNGAVFTVGRFLSWPGVVLPQGESTVACARLSFTADTATWNQLTGQPYGNALCVAVRPSGDVIIGGVFQRFPSGATVNRIARYVPTTGAWSSLGAGMGGASDQVNALAVIPGGDVVAGGIFASAGGVPVNNIARCNPTTGVWSAMGAGVVGSINALAVIPGGDVIAGGSFSTAGDVAANNIARYNPTTGVWSAIGDSDAVTALLVLPGGDVLVGGSGVSRYNPTTGVWTSLGAVPIFGIYALAVLPSGDVIAGGGSFSDFTTLARYSASTGGWTTLNAYGNNFPPGRVVRGLAVLPGGDVIVVGDFSGFFRYFPGAPAPSITAQPRPVVAVASNTAVFFVGATGGSGSRGNPTYAWRKDGVAIDTAANPSAATAGLTLNNVQAADAGSYDCLVTNSCGGTGTLSNAATLTIMGGCVADVGVTGGIPGQDGVLDNNDFIVYIDAFFNHTGCP